MTVLAIDPGNEDSAWVVYDGAKVLKHGKAPNDHLRNLIGMHLVCDGQRDVAIEMIASYGMPVGREVFDTCVWIGRFAECAESDDGRVTLIYRKDVKLHVCGSPRANDGTIRQALLDRWGGREKAVGKKASPGPLHGVSGDVWAALAVAVTWWETKRGTP